MRCFPSLIAEQIVQQRVLEDFGDGGRFIVDKQVLPDQADAMAIVDVSIPMHDRKRLIGVPSSLCQP